MKQERWRQVERIHNSALELKTGEREAFLERACAGDGGLREEVDRLLARRQEAEDFIERPALEVAARLLADDWEAEPVPDLSGTKLSHYRVIKKIDSGGMGVVYRAEDTNLNRQVAIKLLPDMFSGDPERLARFEREAKLLASLNHPNVAAIYGLEQAEGKRFLALELVEGETLAQRIAKGPLPVDEALEVCRQIAEGLEAAHEKGVIHRDLKPANVKITPEGKVKLLDFGLAKAFQGETAAADATHSPTLTNQMTRPGVILGTAAYMSPEQAKGKTVDKRADIWAFGCVLYECLAGKRAFRGDDVTEVMAKILEAEPDWDLNTGTNTPPTTEGIAMRSIWTPDGKRIVFQWGKSTVLNLFSRPYDGSSPMERLTTSEHTQFPGSWSLDGQTLAFVENGGPGHVNDILLWDARSRRVRPFLDSQFWEAFPEFSPDGRWIAYTSTESKRQEVYVLPFPGPGMKHTVSSQGGIEPLWARNGKQLFYRGADPKQDQVWVVDVRTDGGFSAGKPRLLFERPGYMWGTPTRTWDLSQDGQRFLMVKYDQRKPTPVTEMILVQNWFEELKRLAPSGK